MYYLWNSLHRLEGSTVGSLYTINGALTSSGDSSELELTLVASVSVATLQKCDTPDEGQASNTFAQLAYRLHGYMSVTCGCYDEWSFHTVTS